MPRKPHKRKQSTMIFTCEKCGLNWIEKRNSGKRSKWCPDCKPGIIARQDADRAREYRKRKKSAAIRDQSLSEFKARWGLPSGSTLAAVGGRRG